MPRKPLSERQHSKAYRELVRRMGEFRTRPVTQQEVAADLGIGESYISLILSGKRLISLSLAIKLGVVSLVKGK
jgi:plasmid maintenance system antidote protein VapI